MAIRRLKQIRHGSLKPISLFVITAPLLFTASLFLTRPYQLGDQFFYRALYEYLSHAEFSEITRAQLQYTGSAEPLYGILMWLGSNAGIDKDIYIALINTLFCLAILHLLLKSHATFPFVILVLSNYYLLVLLTSAERLKLSYILFVLAAVSSSRIMAAILVGFTPLLHFQSLIMIGARVNGYGALIRIKKRISRRLFLSILLVAPTLITGVMLFSRRFSSDLANKFNAYSGNEDIFETASIAVLIIIATFVLSRKMESFLILGTCAAFAYTLGSGRMNMIAVMLFIYLVVREKRTGHPLVLTLMAYFSIKSIGYVLRILSNGTGF